MTRDEALHIFARECAAKFPNISKKLVRWNDIVQVAQVFYPLNPEAGIKECLQSCVQDDPQFDGKNTLAESLRNSYGWMLK